jgi:hypothetical protein
VPVGAVCAIALEIVANAARAMSVLFIGWVTLKVGRK